MIHNNYPTYEAGINLTLPIRNRAAQADNAQATLAQRQQEMQYRQTQNTIVLNVRQALIALVQGRAAVAAAEKAEMLAQQTLDDEQKKYQLGASTSYNVVLRSRDLTAAQGTLLARQGQSDRGRSELQPGHGPHARCEPHHHCRRDAGQVSPAFRTFPDRWSKKERAAGSLPMTLRHLVWRLREEFYPESHPYDVLTGCDTSGMVHHRRLGPDAEDYQPIDPDVFRATLAYIQEGFCPFTFVDLGCGKGRALLLAEEYDFQNIVGVEFSGQLAKIAAANAAKIGSQRISVLHGDVRVFEFPPVPLVVFLYNPFSGEIFRSRHGSASQSRPGPLYGLRESSARRGDSAAMGE